MESGTNKKLNILILVSTVGESAFGRTSERLISGLANKCNLSLVLADDANISKITSLGIPTLCLKETHKINIKLSKLLMIFCAKDIRHLPWIIKNKSKVRLFCKIQKPDIIYAYCSLGDTYIAKVASSVAKDINTKYAIHFCDPIPSPKGCETFEKYRINRIKPLFKIFNCASLLSFNNRKIIEHTQKYLPFNINPKSIIVPDTCESTFSNIPVSSKQFVFSYIGQFYKVNRRPDNLIKAFNIFLKNHPDCYLQLVGSGDIDLCEYYIDSLTKEHISVIGWTNHVEEYLKNSNVLLDITLDIKEDLFVSSKIKNYLTINRLILSIARDQSATRDFLKGVDGTIVKCNHGVSSIVKGMDECYKRYKDKTQLTYDERSQLISECSVENVATQLINTFKSI